MRGRVTIIPPGMTPIEHREITNAPKLGELQTLVGGFIELVPFWNTIADNGSRVPCFAFCNEDGKNLGLPRNRRADDLWIESIAVDHRRDRTPTGDYLVGTVVVISGDKEFLDAMRGRNDR
jgi:hypothetical protein